MEHRTLTLNVRGGTRLLVPPSLDQITTYVLLEQEDWFEDEIRFLRRWLRPGMRAVDVGANFGVYATAIAQAVGPGGRVWAFEPTPDTAALLGRSLELNQFAHATLLKQAITDHGGKVSLALNPNSELNAISAQSVPGRRQVDVECTTLDQAAATHDWRDIDFVKLDVEGAELEAVRGGLDFFAKQTPLVMFEIKAGEHVDLRVLDPLAAAGYEFYRLLPGMLALRPFDRRQPVEAFQLNLFACKRDRAAQLAASGLLAASEPAPAVKPAPDAWRAYAAAAPYSRGLAEDWLPSARAASDSDAANYLAGLAAFAESRRGEHGAGTRLRLLQDAAALVAGSVQSARPPWRMISYARIAFELGARAVAVQCLGEAAERLVREPAAATEALTQPLLAPSELFENRASGPSPEQWLACAVIEQFERLRAFSSLWTGTSTPQVLAPIMGWPSRSAEMERRCQLVRMRTGQQRRPEAVPALARDSEDNLNASFWRGENVPK